MSNPQKSPLVPAAIESLLIPDVEAAALAGSSRAHWHRLRAAGKIGPEAIRLGRKLLWDRAEVVAWIQAKCPDARTWAAMQASGRRMRC